MEGSEDQISAQWSQKGDEREREPFQEKGRLGWIIFCEKNRIRINQSDAFQKSFQIAIINFSDKSC